MITILSPAKNLNEETPSIKNPTIPRLLEKTEMLISKLKTYSRPKLMELMKISQQLATLNHQRYRQFTMEHTRDNATPAIYTFNGDVYRGLEVETLSEPAIKYARQHLRILSGLYGVLRPQDLIQPYRLEMGTKLPVRRKKDLYQFWGNDLTELINEDIKKSGSSHVINLASDEYWSALDEKALLAPVIKVNFYEWRKGQYRFLSFNAKRARGSMTRYILENEVKDIYTLKGFDRDDYHFNEDLSDENTLIFTRE